MQQYIPSIGPQEVRKVHQAYTLAREAFGPDIDIIVHCHAELDVPSAIKVAEAVEQIKPLFFEDPIAPAYSESWLALRRTTRLPIMTGENIELAENALPFLQNQAVDCLQPDLINSGGITGTKMIADMAALYRIPDLPAQRQRPGAEHGLAAVLGRDLQLSPDGMHAQRRPHQGRRQQRPGHQERSHEGLHAARPGPGSGPGISEGDPRRRRALVGMNEWRGDNACPGFDSRGPTKAAGSCHAHSGRRHKRFLHPATARRWSRSAPGAVRNGGSLFVSVPGRESSKCASPSRSYTRSMFTRRELARALGAIPALQMGASAQLQPEFAAKLNHRLLGRTGRWVTPLGLGGQASLQWTNRGIDPADIIVRAIGLGINYLDSANAYGPSQANYQTAIWRLHLSAADSEYNAALRERLYFATKTGQRFAFNRAQPNAATAITELQRSMTVMFGDGKGWVPDGAYLDAMQMHNVTTDQQVDQIFEGMDDRANLRTRDRIGVLAGLLDFRDGTNYTGLNPEHRHWIRHIGITGHQSSLVLMRALRMDQGNVLDTLLVALNANDRNYCSHQYNVIPVAVAKGMGVIAMKAFADGVFYGKAARFSNARGGCGAFGGPSRRGRAGRSGALSAVGSRGRRADHRHRGDRPTGRQFRRGPHRCGQRNRAPQN